MQSITLKVRDTSNILETVRFNTKDTSPTRIQAKQAVNYELHSNKVNKAPNHIITKRDGDDLHISLSQKDAEADVIIEGYFNFPESYLIGQAEDQNYYYYIPDTAEVGDYVNSLATGDREGHALGGEPLAAPWWVGVPSVGFNPLWLLGLAAGGLLLARKSDDDDDTFDIKNDEKTGQVAGQSVTVEVLTNDTDADVNATTVTFIDGSKEKVVAGEGTWSIDPTSGDITFTPEDDFTADPTPIEYIVEDVDGNTSNPATVTIDYLEPTPEPEPEPAPQPTPEPQPPKTVDNIEQGTTGQSVTVDVLANDSDPDGDIDPTSVQILGAGKALNVANEGIWIVEKTGNITFEPLKGFLGDPTPIYYTVKDTNGNISNTSKVTIDYPEVNANIEIIKDAIVPTDAKVGSVIEYNFTITNTGNVDLTDVAVNDPKISNITIAKTALAVGETTTATGSYTLTKADFDAGKVENSATATAKDPSGAEVSDVSDSANTNDGAGDADPTVSPLQPLQPPVADDDSNNGELGQPVTINVLANDTDADSDIDATTVAFADGSKELAVDGEGTWTIDNTGAMTFTPENGFLGDPTPVKYTVKDTDGNVSNQATVSVDYPEATANIEIIKDDIVPANAKVGSVIEYNFTITNTGNVDLTDVAVNDPKISNITIAKTALAVGETTTATGSYTLTKADFDAGKVENSATATAKDPSGTEISDVSDSANRADDTGKGDDMTVSPLTPLIPPRAKDDSETGELGQPVTINVLANDADQDSDINPATVAFTDGSKEKVVAGEGTWTIDNTGAVTFTPENGFLGDPTPVQYTVKDTDGNVSNQATVSVDYPEVNANIEIIKDADVPDGAKAGDTINYTFTITNTGNVDLTNVVVNDSKLTDITIATTELAVGEATTATGSYVITDKDVAAGGVENTATALATDPAGNDVSDVSDSANLADDTGADNDPTFTPLAKPQTAPIATDDTKSGDTGESLMVPVIVNDTDAENDLDPTTVAFTDGSIEQIVAGEGTWSVDPVTGNITFVPEAGFVYDPTPIQYTVKDKAGNESNPATVSLDYPEQQAPVATDNDAEGTFVDNKQQPVTQQVVADDTDAENNIDPTTVVFTDGSKELTVDGEGTWTIDATTGDITFTPQDSFLGNPTAVQYTVMDKTGLQSNSATVAVTYPEQQAPVATDNDAEGTFVDNKQQPVTQQVVADDTDAENNIDPTTVIFTDGSKELAVDGEGTWTIDATTGDITFTPEDGFIGDPTAVQYTVMDKTGLQSNSATVSIVYPPQTAPEATDDYKEGQIQDNKLLPVTQQVVANDTDTEGDLNPTTVVFTDGSKELAVDGEGTWTIDPTTGDITFTPLDTFIGNPTDIQYTVDDALANTSNVATVSITYPTKTAPKAENDTADGVLQDDKQQPVTQQVLGNDSDIENNIDPTTVAFADGQKELVVDGEGTWSIDPITGDITFTPFDTFIGNPTPVEYTVKDDTATESNPATVSITYPLQTAPEVVNDEKVGERITGQLQQVTQQVVTNDSDVDGNLDPTTVMFTDGSTELVVDGQGVWTIDATTGDITFTPAEGFETNPDPVEYTVKDRTGLESNPATVTVSYPDAIVPTINEPDDTTAGIRVSEEGLINAIADDIDKVNGSDDTTNETQATGSIVIDDAQTVVFSDVQPATIGGTDVLYEGLDTDSLTAYEDINANGVFDDGEAVLTATISANGNYNVELLSAIDHPDNNSGSVKEDVVITDFAIKATSIDLKEVTGTLSVAIEDDSPDSSVESVDLVVPKQSSNLLLVVDVSGSMGAPVEDRGTRLDVTKQALNTLIDEYDKFGDVKVRLVTYSTEGKEQGGGWLSPVEAKALINELEQGGVTNFDSALANAIEAYGAEGRIEQVDGQSVKNLAYFLSDGIPNISNGDETTLFGEREPQQDPRNGPRNPDSGIQGNKTNNAETGEVKEWREFLRENDIEAMTVALGQTAANNQVELDPIAYDGIQELVDNPADEGKKDDLTIVTSDLTTLEADLKKSIDVGTASGNSLLGEGSGSVDNGVGADGGSKFILTINGNRYEYDQQADTLVTDISTNDKAVFSRKTDDEGNEANYLAITTAEGALFTINLDTTTYEFTGSQDMLDPYQEVVEYTAVDSDGDTVTKTVTFNVSREGDNTRPAITTTPDADPTTPDADPTTPDADPVAPDADPVTPDADPTTPDADPVAPDADPVAPDADPTTPDADPVAPDADPVAPDADPATPDADPTTPDADPVAPDADPTTPDADSTTPDANARSVQQSSNQQSIDLSSLDNIDRLDLTNDVDQVLNISFSDVLDINENNVLFVDGNKGDIVQSTDFSLADAHVDSNVAGYDMYEFNSGSQLYIDLDLAVI